MYTFTRERFEDCAQATTQVTGPSLEDEFVYLKCAVTAVCDAKARTSRSSWKMYQEVISFFETVSADFCTTWILTMWRILNKSELGKHV